MQSDSRKENRDRDRHVKVGQIEGLKDNISNVGDTEGELISL